MTTDSVINELRMLTVPEAAGARERAVEAAHRAYQQRAASNPPQQPRARRLVTAAASVAVLVAISLTPAGHAATGWVSELVGLGHIPANHPPRGQIGGRPTDPTSLGLNKPYPEIVIGKGTTPWSQQYEVSVSRSPQNKYGTCFAFWSPRVGQGSPQYTSQCSSQVHREVIGAICVANSSGCGDAHHAGRTWTSPAIATVGRRVARLEIRPTTPDSNVRGLRILRLPHEFQHEVRAPQPVNAALFFVTHPARSPVRFNVTAYDAKGRVLMREHGGAGAAGPWHRFHRSAN